MTGVLINKENNFAQKFTRFAFCITLFCWMVKSLATLLWKQCDVGLWCLKTVRNRNSWKIIKSTEDKSNYITSCSGILSCVLGLFWSTTDYYNHAFCNEICTVYTAPKFQTTQSDFEVNSDSTEFLCGSAMLSLKKHAWASTLYLFVWTHTPYAHDM